LFHVVQEVSIMRAPDDVLPFRYEAEGAALDDLRRRLAVARWPDRETVNDWTQGPPLQALQAFVATWQDHYNWRTFERRLNRFPQYRTTIDGVGIHFLHVRSKHAAALPILLTHGWPGSIIEFLDLIEPLVDPTCHGGTMADSFNVIVPSLPGHGFSDHPREPGWTVDRIADAWIELMRRLGYSRYVAQGGDWGAMITTRMAQKKAAGLVAIHLNYPLAFPDPLPAEPSPEERKAIEEWQQFQRTQMAYYQMQSTQPQTIGYGLTDSPVGQAGWFLGKFHDWTDHAEGELSALSIEQMLDETTLYWLTKTAASSARMYFDNSGGGPGLGGVELPVGCSIFPKDKPKIQKRWAEACYPNLVHWRELDRGGHFAAFEQPALFVRELRDCFGKLH
jgi:pimeloyl-ACP methyl ester carboxylesterase